MIIIFDNNSVTKIKVSAKEIIKIRNFQLSYVLVSLRYIIQKQIIK